MSNRGDFRGGWKIISAKVTALTLTSMYICMENTMNYQTNLTKSRAGSSLLRVFGFTSQRKLKTLKYIKRFRRWSGIMILVPSSGPLVWAPEMSVSRNKIVRQTHDNNLILEKVWKQFKWNNLTNCLIADSSGLNQWNSVLVSGLTVLRPYRHPPVPAERWLSTLINFVWSCHWLQHLVMLSVSITQPK